MMSEEGDNSSPPVIIDEIEANKRAKIREILGTVQLLIQTPVSEIDIKHDLMPHIKKKDLFLTALYNNPGKYPELKNDLSATALYYLFSMRSSTFGTNDDTESLNFLRRLQSAYRCLCDHGLIDGLQAETESIKSMNYKFRNIRYPTKYGCQGEFVNINHLDNLKNERLYCHVLLYYYVEISTNIAEIKAKYAIGSGDATNNDKLSLGNHYISGRKKLHFLALQCFAGINKTEEALACYQRYAACHLHVGLSSFSRTVLVDDGIIETHSDNPGYSYFDECMRLNEELRHPAHLLLTHSNITLSDYTDLEQKEKQADIQPRFDGSSKKVKDSLRSRTHNEHHFYSAVTEVLSCLEANLKWDEATRMVSEKTLILTLLKIVRMAAAADRKLYINFLFDEHKITAPTKNDSGTQTIIRITDLFLGAQIFHGIEQPNKETLFNLFTPKLQKYICKKLSIELPSELKNNHDAGRNYFTRFFKPAEDMPESKKILPENKGGYQMSAFNFNNKE